MLRVIKFACAVTPLHPQYCTRRVHRRPEHVSRTCRESVPRWPPSRVAGRSRTTRDPITRRIFTLRRPSSTTSCCLSWTMSVKLSFTRRRGLSHLTLDIGHVNNDAHLVSSAVMDVCLGDVMRYTRLRPCVVGRGHRINGPRSPCEPAYDLSAVRFRPTYRLPTHLPPVIICLIFLNR